MKMEPEKSASNQNVMLRQWRPNPTVVSTILQASIAGSLLLIAGIWILVVACSIPKATIAHYEKLAECASVLHESTPCSVELELKQPMKQPVYLVYELTHFYQNYKRFFTSKNNYQLGGNPITESEARKSCSPIVLNSDLYTNLSWNGTALNPNAIASPCGLVAFAFFNDTYQLFSPNGSQVIVSETGIAWPRDKGRMYRQELNSSGTQWIDPQNEHFIVWMRTSGFSNFQKPWGIVYSDLPAGNYTLQINNNYNMSMFGGHKSVFLTATYALGGRNIFLPVCLIIFGSIFLLGAIVFYYRWTSTDRTFGPKQLRL